jgi:predicted nucleic acid-binding protein
MNGFSPSWKASMEDLSADATLLETAESRNLTSIITLDNDFSVYKLKNGHYLKNLLE